MVERLDSLEEGSTRERVMEAARGLLREGGVEALTMRAIARRAGIGTMTTYRHFPSRDAVLAALVAEGFARFQSYFYRALEGEGPDERLWLCSALYLEFAQAHPRLYALMFIHPGPLGALPLDAPGRRQVGAALQFLMDRVRECRAARGEEAPTPDQVRADALRIWSVCHGLVSLHLAGRYDDSLDFEGFYQDTLRGVLVGLSLD